MAAKTGLSYYQAETDRFQDIKMKRLKKRYGCEGYAIYQYILNEIYRVEGCYIRFTDDQMFGVSEYWCIDEERIEAIIDYCAEVELFELITWKTKRVLTSADIQQRYVDICRRAKKKIVMPEDIAIIDWQEVGIPTAIPMPLPLFSEQEIDTKTGPTVYGTPSLNVSMPPSAEISAPSLEVPVPDATNNSAEFRRVPQNSAENRHKEKKRKINPSSIPPPASQEEEEANASPSPEKIERNSSAELCGKPTAAPQAEDYRRKLQALGETCYSMGCAQSDLRGILLIENIALDDSPIWGFIEEMRSSGGQHTFYSHVIPSLRSLITAGRLRVMEAPPQAPPTPNDIKRLLVAIGVPSYEADALCQEAAGQESLLQELISEVRRSKGKILMPAYFIRSRLSKTKKNDIQKTA